MLDAIREAGVRRIAAEVEIGLAGMADRPFADAVVEIEQAGLVGDFGARLGRDQAARRGRRNRRLRCRPGPGGRSRRGRSSGTECRRAGGRCGRADAAAAGCPRPSRRERWPARAWRCFGARRGLGRGRGRPFFSFSSPALTGDGRASRPRRCALPITALRLTPPSSSAIWLAVAPSDHIFFSRSIRSSVHDMI